MQIYCDAFSHSLIKIVSTWINLSIKPQSHPLINHFVTITLSGARKFNLLGVILFHLYENLEGTLGQTMVI